MKNKSKEKHIFQLQQQIQLLQQQIKSSKEHHQANQNQNNLIKIHTDQLNSLAKQIQTLTTLINNKQPHSIIPSQTFLEPPPQCVPMEVQHASYCPYCKIHFTQLNNHMSHMHKCKACYLVHERKYMI